MNNEEKENVFKRFTCPHFSPELGAEHHSLKQVEKVARKGMNLEEVYNALGITKEESEASWDEWQKVEKETIIELRLQPTTKNEKYYCDLLYNAKLDLPHVKKITLNTGLKKIPDWVFECKSLEKLLLFHEPKQLNEKTFPIEKFDTLTNLKFIYLNNINSEDFTKMTHLNNLRNKIKIYAFRNPFLKKLNSNSSNRSINSKFKINYEKYEEEIKSLETKLEQKKQTKYALNKLYSNYQKLMNLTDNQIKTINSNDESKNKQVWLEQYEILTRKNGEERTENKNTNNYPKYVCVFEHRTGISHYSRKIVNQLGLKGDELSSKVTEAIDNYEEDNRTEKWRFGLMTDDLLFRFIDRSIKKEEYDSLISGKEAILHHNEPESKIISGLDFENKEIYEEKNVFKKIYLNNNKRGYVVSYVDKL